VHHALQQAVFILGVFGGQADGLGPHFFHGDLRGGKRPQGLQQLRAHLGHQPDGRGHGDVGDDMRGVLQPQAILDQTQPPRLAHQVVEDLLQTFGPQPLAKIGKQGVVRQRAFQTDPQEYPVGDVEAGGSDHFAVRQPILPGQEFQFQHEDAVEWRPAKGFVRRFHKRPKLLKVDGLKQTSQKVVLGHHFEKRLAFGIHQRPQTGCCQHRTILRNWRLFYHRLVFSPSRFFSSLTGERGARMVGVRAWRARLACGLGVRAWLSTYGVDLLGFRGMETGFLEYPHVVRG